jgi:hypothetical protein
VGLSGVEKGLALLYVYFQHQLISRDILILNLQTREILELESRVCVIALCVH